MIQTTFRGITSDWTFRSQSDDSLCILFGSLLIHCNCCHRNPHLPRPPFRRRPSQNAFSSSIFSPNQSQILHPLPLRPPRIRPPLPRPPLQNAAAFWPLLSVALFQCHPVKNHGILMSELNSLSLSYYTLLIVFLVRQK